MVRMALDSRYRYPARPCCTIPESGSKNTPNDGKVHPVEADFTVSMTSTSDDQAGKSMSVTKFDGKNNWPIETATGLNIIVQVPYYLGVRPGWE